MCCGPNKFKLPKEVKESSYTFEMHLGVDKMLLQLKAENIKAALTKIDSIAKIADKIRLRG
jgi:hypothetical protein